MKPRVLIVEDSLTVRMDLEEAFAEGGFSPVLCQDLASARQALQEGSFALVILDLLLPDGDGIDLLREIKSAAVPASIPVIVLSQETEVRQRLQGLETGADDYIGKPYDRQHLVNRARQLIGPAAAEASGGPRPAPLVLLIDDSPTFREEFKHLLESQGYRVTTAATGEEGLRLTVQLRPNAVVVDGMLPGIDGATTVRRLRSEVSVARTPCLLLTGSSQAADELLALEAGADSFMSKDAAKELILARLAAMLRDTSEGDVSEQSTLIAPRCVLAVDDSPTFLGELSAALQQEQFEVIQASSGEEALQLLAVQKVDCILLDLVMPGLTGEETCRLIKSKPEGKDVPVMILTARKDQEVIVSCLHAGADDFVLKSADFTVLMARLRAQLRRKQFQEETRRIMQVAAKLRKNETMLQALFEFAPDAVVVIDRNGRMVRANGQAILMFGYTQAELYGQDVELLIPERFREPHRLYLREFADNPRVRARSDSSNLWARRKDGSEFAVDINLGPVQTDDGLLVLATVRDITTRKHAEAQFKAKDEEVRETSRQLWQASKLATMGELSASIAHELNNPLATVSLRVESLLEKFPAPSPAHDELKVIEQEVDRMAQLVANLLQFSRAEGSRMSTVELREEIEKTLELVHHHLRKRRVAVVPEFPPDLPCIQADRLKLRQLFLNLIVNASDAMPQGGTLTIRARGSTLRAKPAVELVFADTGEGIAPEHLEKVMEPFFTTKPEGKGTGLGLAICRRLIQEHGGTIELSSVLGQGTTVRLVFPVQNGDNHHELMND